MQYRNRPAARVRIPQPGLDPRQEAGGRAAEKPARDQIQVVFRAAGNPADVRQPVGGGPAERKGQCRTPPEPCRPSVRSGSDPALEMEGRPQRAAEPLGEIVQGVLKHIRPGGQAGRPCRLRLLPRPLPNRGEGGLRIIRQPLEHRPERLRPVGVRADEAYVPEPAQPPLPGHPERLGMGRNRVLGPERLDQPVETPRKCGLLRPDRLEHGGIRPLRRRRRAGDDPLQHDPAHGALGGPPRMKSPTVPSITGSSPDARANSSELPDPMPHGERPSSVAAR